MPMKYPITKKNDIRNNRSERGDFFKTKAGRLELGDGETFHGRMPSWQGGPYYGEVVFNTGMTGYVESLTDPSYRGQILVFTYPLIGNYGVQTDSAESSMLQVSGVIVSEAATNFSHSGTELSLLDWLKSQKVPVLMEVDTRALTKHLRSHGTMYGAIGSQPAKAGKYKPEPYFVGIDSPRTYNGKGKKKVILVDCGSKENILRSLVNLDLEVKRVPYDYDYVEEDYDGVLLSNGPGDPTDYVSTIEIARKALKKGKPVFGICLGSQIMALAAGAKTYKLKFGHRGHNQPCLDSASGKGYITSQNHGYAIDEASLPTGWEATFKNLNDGSVEGIRHKTRPFFSVQFHPEACPGPTDTGYLFERFRESL